MKLIAIIAAMVLGSAAQAQGGHPRDTDPARLRHQDSRQFRGEPAGNAAKRGVRCRIVTRRGQDRHVCAKTAERRR